MICLDFAIEMELCNDNGVLEVGDHKMVTALWRCVVLVVFGLFGRVVKIEIFEVRIGYAVDCQIHGILVYFLLMYFWWTLCPQLCASR